MRTARPEGLVQQRGHDVGRVGAPASGVRGGQGWRPVTSQPGPGDTSGCSPSCAVLLEFFFFREAQTRSYLHYKETNENFLLLLQVFSRRTMGRILEVTRAGVVVVERSGRKDVAGARP